MGDQDGPLVLPLVARVGGRPIVLFLVRVVVRSEEVGAVNSSSSWFFPRLDLL